MASLDVSFLMYDPVFADTITLFRRLSTVNQYGESIIVDEPPIDIIASVQSTTSLPGILKRTQKAALLSDGIEVYYNGILYAESSPNGYSDILLWKGNRYQVKTVDEQYSNWGGGFTKANCKLVPAHV